MFKHQSIWVSSQRNSIWRHEVSRVSVQVENIHIHIYAYSTYAHTHTHIHIHSSIYLHIHSTHTTHFRQPVKKKKKKSYYWYISPQSNKIHKRNKRTKNRLNAGISMMQAMTPAVCHGLV